MVALDSRMLNFLALMVLISLIPMAVVLGWMIVKGLTVRRLLRGQRSVICPETGQPVSVAVDAGHAGYTAAYEAEEVRLSNCTRWPEKAGCAQDCTKEIKH